MRHASDRSLVSLSGVRLASVPASEVGQQRTPRSRPFGPASEAPYRRRASDWIRLIFAAGLLVALTARATHIGAAEQRIFELFDSAPRGLAPLCRAVEGLGALWAVGMVGAAALIGRRWRLARDLVIAGALAWAIARVVGSDVVGHIGLRASLRTLTHVGVTPSFPLARLSIVVAVVATAGPYLGRPVRRLGHLLVAALGLSALYIGIAFPRDLAGGVLLGWAVAAAIHLVFQSPGGRPTARQMQSTLAQIGIESIDVHLASVQAPDATVFDGIDAAGPLWVRVIGRDEVDAQLLAKVWRFIVYKEPVPPLYLSRTQQVEHEACMTLLAGSAGVRVPNVIFVGRAGPGAALLVLRLQPGRRLAELEGPAASEPVLRAVWREVHRLHAGESRTEHWTPTMSSFPSRALPWSASPGRPRLVSPTGQRRTWPSCWRPRRPSWAMDAPLPPAGRSSRRRNWQPPFRSCNQRPSPARPGRR